MKKLFLVLAAATLSFGAAYAQDANEAPAQDVAVEQVVEAEAAEVAEVESVLDIEALVEEAYKGIERIKLFEE